MANSAFSFGGGAGDGKSIRETVTQNSHGFVTGDVLRFSGAGTFAKAQASSAANAEVVGVVESTLDSNTFVIVYYGEIRGLTGLTATTVYFLSASTAGALTATPPTDTGTVVKPVLVAGSSTEANVINHVGTVNGGNNLVNLDAVQPVGSIHEYAGTTPPNNWLLCDGSAVSRTAYSELYAVIGTTFGVGDGSSTFNLPDFRGRSPLGAGSGPGLTSRTLGGSVGIETLGTTTVQTGTGATVTNGTNNVHPSTVVNFIIRSNSTQSAAVFDVPPAPNVIESDLDLYVSTTGSDVTGNGNVTFPWATIDRAYSFLKDKWINEGVTVRIWLTDGVHTYTAPISIPQHPQANQIVIRGINTYSRTLTSVQSTSGSAGAWSFVLNIGDVTNVAVGDYAIIHTASSGTNPLLVVGCWEITNVDVGNNRITVSSTSQSASVPSSTISATVVIVKTIVRNTTNSSIVFSGASGSRLVLQDLVVKGAGVGVNGGTGINFATGSILRVVQNVGVTDCTTGIIIEDEAIGDLEAASIGVCKNTNGIIVRSAKLRSRGAASCGNTAAGVTATNGSSIRGTGSSALVCVANVNGIISSHRSVIRGDTSLVTGFNTGTGYVANYLSLISTPTLTATSNGTAASPAAEGTLTTAAGATVGSYITAN